MLQWIVMWVRREAVGGRARACAGQPGGGPAYARPRTDGGSGLPASIVLKACAHHRQERGLGRRPWPGVCTMLLRDGAESPCGALFASALPLDPFQDADRVAVSGLLERSWAAGGHLRPAALQFAEDAALRHRRRRTAER